MLLEFIFLFISVILIAQTSITVYNYNQNNQQKDLNFYWTCLVLVLSIIGALVSGTALAFGAAIVTSGSLPAGSPLTSPSTSTTVVTSPTSRPVDHSSTTVVREEHVVVPTTTREHVATTVPSYSGYDENDEHHWGERNDEWEGREDD